ncbi:uncharacterized protein LOC130505593 [Raphanus sativus]|uniref:Uncharacterized protein LOC130505593 n=1 Tax=Raphanus sativus TaxID=3726 RepID=A0A9W3CX58_RAPSA|nr:uncharacterized protein LOC130505593 [Raphanus sativus]
MKKKGSKSTSSGPHFPSLLKIQDVVNLTVQAHGKSDLARACTEDETSETVPEGWFCVHEKYISKCHLRFPLPTLLLDLLDHYQLALPQLCPSVIRVINGFITRAKEEGVIAGLTELMSLFSIKESTSKDGGSGTYYLPCRPGLGVFKFTAKIKDPVKLSGKLTRALHRKLQHSPNTWTAYITTRVESAWFPERYKASFPDSVSVAGLEVSDGESVFEVSSGASTSEKTQSQKMPIQPSFRSRGRSTKAASSSRGSDKNQGGSFLDSVKEVLDEGGSAHAKDVGPSEPRVQEVGLPSEVPVTEADPQMSRDPPEFEPPRSKRSRTDQVDRPSRHMKRTGCALPSIANLSNKEEYVDIAHCMGQLAGAINRAQLKFEDVVQNAPSAEELAQQGTIESQTIDTQVKNRKIGELYVARKIAEYQVKELIASSQSSQKNKEAEVRLAVRRGKREVADAYNKVLSAEDEYARLVAMMPEAVAVPVEVAPGDGDKEMEEEVPDEEDDPVDKGAEKSSGDKEV